MPWFSAWALSNTASRSDSEVGVNVWGLGWGVARARECQDENGDDHSEREDVMGGMLN